MRRHTRFPRSAWTVFRRIHLTALAADWRRTTLSVVGVMLGVVVMLGVTVLQSSLVRPFDAFGPSLTHAAGPGVLEVTPEVSGRLPLDLMNRIREEVPDARAVVPVVVGLTPVEIGGSTRGFFVLGGSCDVELLFGSFNCERRAKEEKPADGPGIPLEIPEVIARRDNLHLGDEVRLPGQPPGAAHLGWTFPEFDRVAGVNEGSVIMTPSLGAAASLLGAPGYSTIVFVLPKPGAQIQAEVAKAVGNLGSVGPPRAQQPLVLALSAQAYNLMMLAGIVIGFLIAVNTVLLAVEDRRPVFGTVGAIGARPLGLFAGLLGEGVLIGLAGSLAAVPGGFLLGSFLVDRFARSLLSGSGGLVVARFEPSLFATGALSGVACGVLAMMGPAWQLFRQGPFASMASFGGTQRIRTTPLWSLVVGLALLGCAVALLRVFGTGRLPLDMGSNGMTLGLVGIALVVVWAAPRAALWLAERLSAAKPAAGRLLKADIRRYATLLAISVGVLTLGGSLAIGSQSMQELGVRQIAAQKADRLSSSLLISAQSVLDQREGRISDQVFEKVRTAAAGKQTASRWRAMISSGVDSRLVIGIDPDEEWYGSALYEPIGDPAALWRGIASGGVALSEIAANRLGVGAGGTVELPTAHGPHRYEVAGVFRPQMVHDAVLGDVVLASEATARSDWAAVRDQMAVRYGAAADASAHRSDFLSLGAGLSVYDDAQWSTAASAGVARFFKPFTLTGYVVMMAAGLSVLNVFVLGLVQRVRERAVLRAVGVTPRAERAVILAQSAVIGGLAAVFGVLGGLGLMYLESLASPVYYGVFIAWGADATVLGAGAGVAVLLALGASVYPLVHAGKLEAVDVLRSG